jgi:hypothetical protein
MKKFWTIISGKLLGTAHINREGQRVDFREAGEAELEEGYQDNGGKTVVAIRVAPSKGVVIAPLRLTSPQLAITVVIEDSILERRTRETWVAMFEECFVSCSRVVHEHKNTPEADEAREAKEHERALARRAELYPPERWAEMRRVAYRYLFLEECSADEFVRLAKPTAAEWRSFLQEAQENRPMNAMGAWYTRAFDALAELSPPEDYSWEPPLGAPRTLSPEESEAVTASIRLRISTLQAYGLHEREVRKAEFLARKGE